MIYLLTALLGWGLIIYLVLRFVFDIDLFEKFLDAQHKDKVMGADARENLMVVRNSLNRALAACEHWPDIPPLQSFAFENAKAAIEQKKALQLHSKKETIQIISCLNELLKFFESHPETRDRDRVADLRKRTAETLALVDAVLDQL